MGMVDFAENELNIMLRDCSSEEERKMQEAINKDILEVVKVFSKQGHSGFSAHYSINILNRLLDYKPLTDITDAEEDWTKLDYSDDIAYQCKRCPSLFKDADGKVYNVEAKVFSDDNGHTWYNCADSREYVTLPYSVPLKPTYVIIDNAKERDAIMTHIINIIEILGKNDIDAKEVSEETLLATLIKPELFEELEDTLLKANYINKPLFRLKDCDEPKMWELINIIMKSDKEVILKQ